MNTNKSDHANTQSQRPSDLANAEIALNRAAAKARDLARKNGTAVVIFENRQIREERPATI